ncbi:MAG: TatD family hydrolase [Geothrix sp.]|uniref:TatD family hydrolase n=1 Tax=Geothrix sp. TaxID=1962974 RepID=UPI0017FE5EAF|nr:TatD family hydrolase [Geothrix sp.]NWJ42046.1 TatD family hydrolase [Geothrix sp.]WIL19986.1 MAG: TatD family hydrolase [Geothrix sp.]
MLVDAHCHLTGSHLADDQVEATLSRARSHGVTGFIAVGTDLEDSRVVLALTTRIPDVQASLGVHPHEAKSWSPEVEAELGKLLADPAVRFVGETGLDWHYDLSPRDEQEAAFRAQIRLAKAFRKPLMIHTRSAPEATLRILEEEGADAVRGIIHCFSEDRAFAVRALDLGFYLSFSGITTFKKAEAVRDVAAWAPADRILVETDAPFLAPVPYRGKPNEPGFVRFTAEAVAELRGIPAVKLAELTTRNLEALCGWAPSS